MRGGIALAGGGGEIGMRITGGSFRGRRLQAPPGKEVRPTTDKVRQAIFNILAHETPGAQVLDLFAGSGALGIEALSRGAESSVFVEKYRQPLQSLRRNLANISLSPRVIEADWLAGVKTLALENQQFDLIFADPPYGMFSGDTLAEPLLGDVSSDGAPESTLLAPEGILIIESSASDEAVTKMTLLKERLFDTTRVSFYSR
jgi:16S rRNA (guanine966-N2)-methyltransferase